MEKLIITCVLVGLLAIGTSQATPIDLGTAANFAVLGGSAVTNSGSLTFITGDVGSCPTPSVTGLLPAQVIGMLYLAADPATALAQTDLLAAYTTAAN
ncbi:MAG: hypothetical protein A2Y10_11020 [Planctomycetes bacterium GWF2_41_51]|nr:MAG: hypothetical protein A2Y10_11020 [Planctomycetes bacterium GWF2_41_51]HBG28420.1 hypothetical protein [Phycisphaerales bacterium]